MKTTTKIILIVREPISRTISDYQHLLHMGLLLRDTKFRDVIMVNQSRDAKFHDVIMINQSINRKAPVLQPSLYARYLLKWKKYFPPSQIHIVDGENMKINIVEEAKKLERFLGLNHRISHKDFFFNNTKGFYCFKKPKKDFCFPEYRGQTHPPISNVTMKTLKEFFKPINQIFFKLINRSFPWWLAFYQLLKLKHIKKVKGFWLKLDSIRIRKRRKYSKAPI